MEAIIGGAGAPTNPNPNPNGGAKVNVNLSDAPYLTCDSCGHDVFEEKMKIKKISKFMTGAPQDSIVPLPVIACAKCGHINEMFKPQV
jgi:hypothetical protein